LISFVRVWFTRFIGETLAATLNGGWIASPSDFEMRPLSLVAREALARGLDVLEAERAERDSK
jgi:hypothetical protein